MLDISNTPGFDIPYIHIDLSTVFEFITNGMYEVYVFMTRTTITLEGFTFSLWDALIAAMVLAFMTAACLPETPGDSKIDEFFENDIYVDD